jgi:hypothetical protein
LLIVSVGTNMKCSLICEIRVFRVFCGQILLLFTPEDGIFAPLVGFRNPALPV